MVSERLKKNKTKPRWKLLSQGQTLLCNRCLVTADGRVTDEDPNWGAANQATWVHIQDIAQLSGSQFLHIWKMGIRLEYSIRDYGGN